MSSTLKVAAVGSNFHGVTSIYQYTNSDGTNPGTVCGQAACATLLTYCGFQPADIQTLRDIESKHPPDLAGGHLGTSPWRIESILKAYGAQATQHVSTLDEVKKYIQRACPVICVIQNTGGLFGIGDGAHWFVVFAYDDDGVFVTNYDPVHLTWDAFNERWDTVIPNAASVNFKAITNTSRIAPDFYIARRDRRRGEHGEVSWG